MRRRAFITGSATAAGAVGIWAWTRRGSTPGAGQIALSAELSVAALPADVSSEAWAVVRVTAAAPEGFERPPINVGLLIDASSSMQGDAIAAARSAAAELVDTLHDGDRLSVVSFGSSPRRVVDGVVVDDDAREAALEAIAAIEAEGTTDLAGGLDDALTSLERFVAAGTVSRLVVLSDGVPNDPSPIPSLSARAASSGVTITSLGFGLGYDEILLEQLARESGGAFLFVDEPAQIGPTFQAQTRRLQGVLAKDLRLMLVPGPKCRITVVDGVAVGGDPRRWEVALGDLSDGEERVVAVRVAVGPHREGATAELLDATIAYRSPASGQPGAPQSAFLSAPVTGDEAVLAAAVPVHVQQDVARAEAAEATLGALQAARDGDVARGRAVLESAIGAGSTAVDALNDEALAEQVQDMKTLARDLDEVPEPDPSGGTEDVVDALAPAPATSSPPVSRTKSARRAHSNALQNFRPRQAR